MQRLIKIQQGLKAPKHQYNSFGEYNYRSCEDILEAVKPWLKDLGLALILKDDIVCVGDRYYVQATAILYDENGKQITSTTALAREALEKKKSDESQLTGSASSYARKYALNGLFCIDDVKDADSTNKHGKDELKETSKDNKDEQIISEMNKIDNLSDLNKFYAENKDNVCDRNALNKLYANRAKELRAK
ncbi:MAG: ERF family protein [Candidatus Gastranaerophilales bacterium]|nr:ERF family protein [Candidatus Gastranaerophilales bacterium]